MRAAAGLKARDGMVFHAKTQYLASTAKISHAGSEGETLGKETPSGNYSLPQGRLCILFDLLTTSSSTATQPVDPMHAGPSDGQSTSSTSSSREWHRGVGVHKVDNTPSVEESSSDAEDVEPQTDGYFHDNQPTPSPSHRERGISRRRLMSHPHAQKKRRSYWPSGTVISKNNVVRRSKTFGSSVSKAFTDALAKLEEMSNENRNRQFHKLFSFIPSQETVIVSYSCALIKEIMLCGRMFVSQNWVCFHSHIFTYETQVTIKVSSITRISKARTAFVIPNAIRICTDTEKYVFGSLLSRQSTYMQLIRVWKNAVTSTELEEEELSSCTSPDCSETVHSDSELVESLDGESTRRLEQRLLHEEECFEDDTTANDSYETENDILTNLQASHNQATSLTDSSPTLTTGSCPNLCKLLFAMSVFKSLERLIKLLKAMTPVQVFLLLTACLIICLTVSAVILTFRITRLQPQLENKPLSLQYTQTVSEWSSLWWSQQAAHSQLLSKMWESIGDNLKTLAQVHQSLHVLQGLMHPSLNQDTKSLVGADDQE